MDQGAWRIWSGTEWFDTSHSKLLKPDCLHDPVLRGDLIDGMVRSIEMICDDTIIPFGQSFASVATVGNDDLFVTLQLGGNHAQDAHECLFDDLTLGWWNRTCPWCPRDSHMSRYSARPSRPIARSTPDRPAPCFPSLLQSSSREGRPDRDQDAITSDKQLIVEVNRLIAVSHMQGHPISDAWGIGVMIERDRAVLGR
jgi:hypothetical protein